MAVAYKSAGAGAMTETNGATLNLQCPATVDANDILIAHVVVWGTTYSPTTPDGWTLLFGPYGLGTGTPTARAWAYGKLATGNEDGSNVSFGTIASTTGRMGRIYSFSGYKSGTIKDVVPSASYAGNSSETDPVIQSVTTTVAGAKAIALVSQDDNNYHSSLGAVTGGSWAEAVSDYVNTSVGPSGGCLQLQVGTPTSDPGTIAGGTVAGNDDEANTICFEIRPNTPNSPPTVELNTPTDEEEISDYTPELEFTGTDPEDDDVEYEVQVATDDQFSVSEVVTCASNGSGSTAYSCYSGQIEAFGQSFEGDGNRLYSATFNLAKTGSPTGNAYVKIYAHTGTFGTDGKPTGSALAVSDAFDVSTLSGSQTNVEIFFSGDNRIVLDNGTYYCVVFEWFNSGDSSNKITFYYSTSSVCDGNFIEWIDGLDWTYLGGDCRFVVKTKLPESLLIDALSTEETGFRAGASHPTASGEEQSYTIQDTLEQATYYWRVRALDPSGTNTWGDWSSPVRSFSLTGTAASSDRLLYTKGKAAVSSDELLYTRGKLTNSSDRLLYSKGSVAGSSDRLLYTKGRVTTYSERGLYTRGRITVGDDSVTVCDSYAESNQSSFTNLYTGDWIECGQSFTGSGGILDSVKFYLYKKGTPPGVVVAKVYAHSGVFGTKSLPTGDPLAVSDNVTATTLETSFALTTFVFSGANRITLTSGERYVVTIFYNDGTSSNSIVIGVDISSPTHSGNFCGYSGFWQGLSSYDTPFYVYTVSTYSRLLYTKGGLAGSSDRLLYSKGIGTDSSERNLYTKGGLVDNSDRLLYTKGKALANTDRLIYSKAFATSSSTRNIYSRGRIVASSERLLYTKGKIVSYSERGLYTIGTIPKYYTDSERLIYTKGVFTSSSDRDLYSVGGGVVNSERGLYTLSEALGDSDRPVYTKGFSTSSSDRGLYTKGDDHKRYWVGGSGNWSSTSHWSTSSGGSSGASIPTSEGDVFIDENSGFEGGGTIVIDDYELAYCKNFTCSSGHTFNIDDNELEADFNVYGSLVLEPGVSFTGYLGILLSSSTSSTITSNGATIGYAAIEGIGTYALEDDVTFAGLYIYSGTFDANDKDIIFNGVFTFSADEDKTVNVLMGSGTWEFTGKGLTMVIEGEGTINIYPETSTIKISNPSAANKYFYNNTGSNQTFNNIDWTGNGSLYIYDSNTFNDFKAENPSSSILFERGKTTTVNSFNVVGSAGGLVTLGVFGEGTDKHTLSKSSGVVVCDYLDISNSIATGGATWYAGVHSTDSGNNSGWIWEANSVRGIYSVGSISSNSEKNLYSRGFMLESSERSLYTTGSILNSSERLLYSIGISTGSSERGLYTGGYSPSASDRLLYTVGVSTGSSDRPLYTEGAAGGSSDRFIYSSGVFRSFSDRFTYTIGVDTSSSDRRIYTYSVELGSSERDLYTIGVGSGSSEIPIYTEGFETDSSERGVYSRAGIPSSSTRNLYIKGTWKPWVDKFVEYGTIYTDEEVVVSSNFVDLTMSGSDTFTNDTATTGTWVDVKASATDNFIRKV